MTRRSSSLNSDDDAKQDAIHNIRTKPPHIYDNLTKRLLKFGITLSITTFIGLIVRYAVQEFDPTVSTITVTTSRVNNRDIASLSVSKNFLERILEFIEESIAIVSAVIPIGFPICTLFNKYFAKLRAGNDKIDINSDKVLDIIPKYVVIGDSQACQMPNSTRLRPLVRDTIYHLIKAHLKPKLIVEDSHSEARKLGIRIGLIRREHHKLAVIKSVDLLRNITDSRGDIKQGKVRYLLSRMKIMSQATPADKSLLIYLIQHCESLPNENLTYLGYSFTDPEAMRIADCGLTFQDCSDDDVKKDAQVILKSESMSFTDLYLFIIICLLRSNITQSYALYQLSASISCCLYRFLSITVFQEQLISHSQFTLIVIIQQVFAILALMTKWLSSLPLSPMNSSKAAQMSHEATEDVAAKQRQKSINRSMASMLSNGDNFGDNSTSIAPHYHSSNELGQTSIRMAQSGTGYEDNETLTSASSSSSLDLSSGGANDQSNINNKRDTNFRRKSQIELNELSASQRSPRFRKRKKNDSNQHIHLSGIDLDQAIINSNLVTSYKQTFHSNSFIDDVTYRLVKLHIAYQILVMIIIMIFGSAMFQLNMNNNRQHQTLALNSLIMNNIFNLANCFNQFGDFNMRSGFKNHPFLVCVILLAVFTQVSLTELNAFGLENLNPMQWFVCFVFASLSALISPLTGQQQRSRAKSKAQELLNHSSGNHQHQNHGQHHYQTDHQYQSKSLPRSHRLPEHNSGRGSSIAKARPSKSGHHKSRRKSQMDLVEG